MLNTRIMGTYYMCMKFFCPYQALQFETTHMKNCSLIPAQLLLIVLTTLTKGAKQNKIVCQAPSSRCDAHQACTHKTGPGSQVTQQGPLFQFTLTCLLGSHKWSVTKPFYTPTIEVILFHKSFRVKSGFFLVSQCKFEIFQKIGQNSECHRIENKNTARQIQLSSAGKSRRALISFVVHECISFY